MNALITANFDESQLDWLENDLGVEIDYRPIGDRDRRYSPAELASLLENVELLVVGYEGVTADVMDEDPDLEIIACTRGGPDANVDIDAATERDVVVLYAPGRNAVSVADFTIGLLLGVARNIARGHYLLGDGEYTETPSADASDGGERKDVTWGVAKGSPYAELQGPELEGKTLGLVGVGVIGRRVADRAAGFDMEVLGFDPFVDEETMASHDVEKVDLEELCRRSDAVSVHCAVTESTRGLVGEEEFALMDEETYFVNTARGAIVDQNALVAALDRGELAGAALDVFDREPLPEDHPLLSFDNVVTTPHIGGAAREVVTRHSQMIVRDVAAVLDGEPPEHVANPSVVEATEQQGDA